MQEVNPCTLVIRSIMLRRQIWCEDLPFPRIWALKCQLIINKNSTIQREAQNKMSNSISHLWTIESVSSKEVSLPKKLQECPSALTSCILVPGMIDSRWHIARTMRSTTLSTRNFSISPLRSNLSTSPSYQSLRIQKYNWNFNTGWHLPPTLHQKWPRNLNREADSMTMFVNH